MIITGSAKLYSIYTSQAVFNGQVTIKISTDGKILVIGQLNFAADNLSLSARLYANLSKIASGEATILLLVKIPDQVDLLTIKGSLQFGFKDILGEATQFAVVEEQAATPTQRLDGPSDGGVTGVGNFNERAYIDITFPTVNGATVDAASVFDLTPEIEITGGDFTLDNTQAPAQVSDDTFRFWLTGTGDVNSVTYTFLFQSWSYTETATNETVYADEDNTTQSGDPAVAGPWVDIKFIAEIGGEITAETLAAIATNAVAPFKLFNDNGDEIDILGAIAIGGGKVRYFIDTSDPDLTNNQLAVGDYTLRFTADTWANNDTQTGKNNTATPDAVFSVVEPEASLSAPYQLDGDGYTVDVNLANADQRIIVTFDPAGSGSLDYGSILDTNDEFTLTRTGAADGSTVNTAVGISDTPVPVAMFMNDDGTASLKTLGLDAEGRIVASDSADYDHPLPTNTAELYALLKKEGITQFAYAITTANFDFAPGTYTLTFTGAWADAAGNTGATGDKVITVEGATAIMVDPGAGAAIDVNLLNGRNYIDIEFPNVPDSDFVYDAASITDGGAEFTLSGAGLGTVQIDNGVAPVRVGGTDAAPIYRYWLTGSFDSSQTYGDVTIAAVEQGWSYRYSDSANPTTDPAIKSGEDGLGVVANLEISEGSVEITFTNIPSAR